MNLPPLKAHPAAGCAACKVKAGVMAHLIVEELCGKVEPRWLTRLLLWLLFRPAP